jgi:hypothetical protein
MDKPVFVVLASGTVVDRSELIKLTSNQIEKLLGSLNFNIKVVDTFASFFTSTNMLALIEANNEDYKLIAEKAGVSITAVEVASMQRAVELRKEITEKMVPPKPPYKFATVSGTWSVDTHLVISSNGIVRRKSNNTYSAGLKTLERVWLRFSPGWAKEVRINSDYFKMSGYTKQVAMLGQNALEVGCQQIQRYELEQLALHQGWKFPEPV